MVLIYIFLMQILMSLLVIWLFSLKECLFFANFKLIFHYWVEKSIYLFWIQVLYSVWLETVYLIVQVVFGEGNGTPLQYSCLDNPMDRGAWWAAVHEVARSLTRLSDFPFTFHFHALEEEMATHSSVLAWRIPGMAGPGGLPSMGSHRVRHNWSDLA